MFVLIFKKFPMARLKPNSRIDLSPTGGAPISTPSPISSPGSTSEAAGAETGRGRVVNEGASDRSFSPAGTASIASVAERGVGKAEASIPDTLPDEADFYGDDDAAEIGRAGSRAADYRAKTEALKERFPGVIIVPGVEVLGDYLRHHTWSTLDCLEVFPWTRWLFSKTAMLEVPFILNTAEVAKRWPEAAAALGKTARNARMLFDPEDLHAWFARRLRTSVQQVLVPVSMLAQRPEALRQRFLELRDEKLSAFYERDRPISRRNARTEKNPAFLGGWGLGDWVKPDYRELLWTWKEENDALAERQGVKPNRVKYESVELPFPTDKLPRMLGQTAVSKTRAYDSKDVGNSTIRIFAWAKHELVMPETVARPESRIPPSGFTQGIALGGERFFEDYRIGLVDLWSARKVLDVFGEGAFREADWRLDASLCAWAKEDARFGPGLPPKAQAAMLGFV